MSSLLNLVAPIDIGQTDTTSLFVKGFASVETVDRSKDIVSPTEFKVEQFMAAPTLLVNHQFWHDRSGNPVAVGKVVSAFPAMLADGSDPEMWQVIDLQTQKAANTFPKAKTPNLKAGSRGLFVVAEVTEPDVQLRAKAGEYSAFSWRGLADSYPAFDMMNGAQRTFKNIDLMEISLVNMPANPDATLVIGKSLDGSNADLVLYSVLLDKAFFSSEGVSASFLQAHHLKSSVVDNGSQYVAVQNLSVDSGSLSQFRLCNGVTFVVGPPVQKTADWQGAPFTHTRFVGCQTVSNSENGVAISSNNLENLIRVKTMSDTNSITIEGGKNMQVVLKEVADNVAPVSTGTRAIPPVKLDGKSPLMQETGLEQEAGLELISRSVEAAVAASTEAVAKQFMPVMEQMVGLIKTLTEKNAAVAEAPVAQAPATPVPAPPAPVAGVEEPVAQEVETPVAVSAATPTSEDETLVDVLMKSILELNSKIESVEKKLMGYSTKTKPTVREEVVAKSAGKQADPNACFDNMFSRQFGVR